jgi:glycosyltransferase involved in cell wall biosynthesis
VQKFVLQNSDEIIFNTHWQKEIFVRHYGLSQKIYVIENPVEPINSEIYENSKTNENFERALSENKYIFTCITREIPYKNLKRLKHIAQGLDIYFESAHGSWESCLKRISLSRAYICASISDISPNQVQEAISLRVPVIISKYTGITKVLQDAGIARVIDPFDEVDMKNAILEMCNEENFLTYKKNLENFHWPQTWNTLFNQYEEILDQE